MIRADFLYRVQTAHLPVMMEKFQKSANPKFDSTPTNTRIEMAFREHGEWTDISLNIYYHSYQDYEARTAYERSQPEWNEIWFSEDDVFELVSLNVYEVASN